MNIAKVFISAFLLSVAGTSRADAQDWQFSIKPYLWLTGMEGDVGVVPDLPPAQVDLSFSDILDNLDFAAMVDIEARRGRFAILGDVSYVALSAGSGDVSVDDVGVLGVDLDSKLATGTLVGSWRVVQRERYSLDLLAGGRMTWSSTEVDLRLDDLQARVVDADETWVDPVVGAEMDVVLSPRWSLAMYGDVGGFGVSSDFTGQVWLHVLYELNDRWALSGGWRYYTVDYRTGDFTYDVEQNGPIFGGVYKF